MQIKYFNLLLRRRRRARCGRSFCRRRDVRQTALLEKIMIFFQIHLGMQ